MTRMFCNFVRVSRLSTDSRVVCVVGSVVDSFCCVFKVVCLACIGIARAVSDDVGASAEMCFVCGSSGGMSVPFLIGRDGSD